MTCNECEDKSCPSCKSKLLNPDQLKNEILIVFVLSGLLSFFTFFINLGDADVDSFFGEPYLVTIIFTFLIFAAAIVTLRIIILICIFFIEENHITLPWKDIEDFFQSGGNDTINFKIQGIGLVEPRTLRRSIGVGGGKGGIGAGTSLSFHAGTEQTKIDSGTICFDKIQISFIGSTKQVTWRWNKILSVRVSHGLTSSTIFVVVSSRKNISGFMLPSSKEDAERLSTYISEHSTDSEK